MQKRYRLLAYFCFILSYSGLTVAEAANDWNPVLIANKALSSKNSYDLVLYVNPRCPYCHKVTDYLNSQGRSIPIKNTQDPAIRAELIHIGGKAQVPCLVIDGKALYESGEIIQWLQNHP